MNTDPIQVPADQVANKLNLFLKRMLFACCCTGMCLCLFVCGLGSSNGRTKTIMLPGGIPLVVVKTPNGLWFGKYEVTQTQWKAVMGENPSRFKGANNPVEHVSWDDCQEFLKKLNALPAVKKSGLTFRLPTEEEWKYACRAGATGNYCRLADGSEITWETLGRVAWFEDNSAEKTHPVGQKEPNAFGLYDMHGNVKEWTSTSPWIFHGDALAYIGPGGGWLSYAEGCKSCKSSTQDWLMPAAQLSWLGFRLCADRHPD